MPKISVIMPVYNGEKYLREAIDSILAQTYTGFEFIIIDDGSSDSSPEIVRGYRDDRIRFYQNEHNMGVAATLNRGLDLATGEYIARMDADDISSPERFAKQVEYMDSHPNCVLCGSNLIVFSEDGTERPFLYSENDASIRADMLFNCSFAHPSIIMRSSTVKKHQLRYDITYEKAEDYELWYRLMQFGDGHNIQQPLLWYRHHSSQVTQTSQPEMRAAVRRLHDCMLNDIGATLDKKEHEVFLQICNGERILTKDKFSAFINGGKKIISVYRKRKKDLKQIYSALNITVQLKSSLFSLASFTWRDTILIIYNKIRFGKSD